MKKQLIILLALLTSGISFSQDANAEFKPSGKPTFTVFWNYHADMTEDASKSSAFELKRAYLGYSYNFSEKVSAKVVMDVGSNSGGSSYTAYLKTAQLDWKASSNVKLSMGMIGMKQFKVQESHWGYRYIFKSYMDQNGFGSSADLGLNAEFKLSDFITANVTISNGEGYKKLQDDDGKQKFAGSLIITPADGFTAKIYVDSQAVEDSDAVSSLGLFAGYKGDNWRLGAEYNKLSNAKKYSSPMVDHNLDGISIYSTYSFDSKWEIFGRFDQVGSNTLSGDAEGWNYSKDGNQIIAGLQYAPIKGLKFSLNYQGFSYDDDAVNNKSMMFLNAEFKL